MGSAQSGPGHAVPTIDGLLDLRAADNPTATFLRFSSGELTYGEARSRSIGLAHGFSDLGVQRGHLVPVLMPNGPTFAVTWLALCTFGAVSTLLNTEFRGPALVHALNLSGAKTVVADADLVPHLGEVADQLVHLRRLVVVDGLGRASPTCRASRSSTSPVCAPTSPHRSPRLIHRSTRRWCCSPRARPDHPRVACCPTATPFARRN